MIEEINVDKHTVINDVKYLMLKCFTHTFLVHCIIGTWATAVLVIFQWCDEVRRKGAGHVHGVLFTRY